MRKVMVHWNISENRAILCRHANHKQCCEAKKNSKFRLVALKRFYGTIIGGRGSKFSARSANKWSSNGRGRHAITGLYYVMVPSNGLFSAIIIIL